MRSFLANLFGALSPRSQPVTRRRPSTAFRPGLEALEERQMLNGSPLAADADRSLTTPTGYTWYHGVDAAFLTSKINQQHARIIDLEVESGSPQKFTAVLVPNSGDYAKKWWWYYDQTLPQLQKQLTNHHARIEDLESYSVNGHTRYAAVLVSNTGANAKNWHFYVNVTPSFVAKKLDETKSRLVDLERHDNGRMDVVMVANKGVDKKDWWWYHDVSATTLGNLLNSNHARLTDLERQADGNFSAIMVQSQGEGWEWYYDKSAQELQDIANVNGERFIHIDPYTVNGEQRFAGILLQNAYFGAPKSTPLSIQFTDLNVVSTTSGPGDDEPYVVTWVGNLKNPLASFATRSGVYEMDDGETVHDPHTVYGAGGLKAPIASADDVVILSAALENDWSNPDGVVATVQAEMLASVLSVVNASPALSRVQIVDKLLTDMGGALDVGVAPGGLRPDDYSAPQELRLTEPELFNARLGTPQHFALDFYFAGGHYQVEYQLNA
jgi:hypothetical protein